MPKELPALQPMLLLSTSRIYGPPSSQLIDLVLA
jgi:hypothetical protein